MTTSIPLVLVCDSRLFIVDAVMSKTAEYIKSPRVILCNDFVDVNPASPIFTYINGFTIDIENVLTDGIAGGDPTIRPEALSAIGRMYSSDKRIALLTNCTDVEFVQAVGDQINDAFDTTLRIQQGTTKNKLHQAPFLEAARMMQVAPHRMGHIDDQYKSFIGAMRAGYGVRIWPYPWGEHQHTGVERFRPIEMGLLRRLVSAHPHTVNIGR